MRISSRGALRIEPRLFDELDLVQREERAVMIEGLLLGLAVLVVPFSLVVGVQIRSPLLLVSAAGVLTGVLMACVSDGYLIPVLLRWGPALLSVAGTMVHLLFVWYLAMLFKAGKMPPLQRVGLCLVALVPGSLMVAGFQLGYSPTRQWIAELSWLYGMAVPAFGVVAWRLGLRPDWLGWTVVGLYGLQGLTYFTHEVPVLAWPLGVDRYGLMATPLGILLLAATLVREFSLSRRRERFALARLESQQQAEEERLEHAVARRTAQLRESLRARSELLARISHDLRSPLAGIVDYARLIKHGSPSEHPEAIERNARRQLARIDELLEFSRGELQRQELVLAPGYLFGFLNSVEQQARFLLQREGCQLECRFAGDLPPVVHTDFRRLECALINLLETAAKGAPCGDVIFSVDQAYERSGVVELTFAIDGRADSSARRSSEGPRPSVAEDNLRLANARQWLQQMGSDLEPEQGATLRFCLQLTTGDEDELDLLMDDSASAPVQGDGLRVLVVDDVSGNREGLSDLLGGYGFDVSVAEEGGEALRLLQRDAYDLVITDQMMSGLDGWALLAAVRERYPRLPVLLYSAVPPARPAHWRSDLTFDAVLLKPAEGGALLDHVARLLGPSATVEIYP